MKPTLLILAAGMGSRYGGLKQMDELGPSGESIIDYSVFDAIRAGFGKVVFVIREDFADAFKERFEPRLKGKIETEYVFQSLDKIPAGFSIPEGREKPWGTGHAMLMAKDVINTPFAIINADDFYGQKAYQQAVDFIASSTRDNEYAMIGYALKNTLSDYGTVSRGICGSDAENNLTEVTERTKIGKEGDKVFFYEEDQKGELNPEAPVSMNFWIFKPEFFGHLEEGFKQFLKEKGHEMKSEFYFNIQADNMVKAEVASVKIISTPSKWFGVTYQEDKPLVKKSLQDLHSNGDYPNNLWS
ncbi:nucleotidyltransferase family protein [Alkalitalea saponilacus]|uniref:UTP-glucose-1-phosphate uridylyltransferase n=1 Tax=Alkalitalea saponilacus TaxID=889453 RepID=A0A1T5GTR2_9BACT|nr:sugar phosphate nucleotidyltransferase [Alkalitalea saponilacus]ASB48189.1 nucleotidyltransferase [Alkalitalea saponilacus]SKC11862.1 UTP-glucose-1-phosphate uridylyltransferase [Alkalitalea saponilacus]